ncbi:D-alanyl-D-alanine carboxypeptidase family protein [Actinocrispum wychmicini]|uniref:D-alanyl-D-alanine carboxypeptidase (Penicillin-binding protein 5/6) n=1 Tax=Actinocrispum wychmicini TaxID=1213861 RepID=A0A4R2JY41_9PSEU|nr:serine hydrolase [Actinocrispum wychmicini]TCO65521.1 D-alanyl-D-alanine carboxypeptidase (penicillin-binding protein 5/6) [Actinocrispum wychmicini]
MVLTSRRVVAVLLAVLCLALSTSLAAAAQPDAACQDKAAPPKPVDTSENPKPGQSSPGPLPLPDTPAGGPKMASCGITVPPGAPEPPKDVTTVSWVVADLDSGQILGAKDPHARERPASLIKVLLSLVVMDELKMDTVVTGTTDDANQDGTRVGIGPGGQYTNQQLFFSLLMRSGNDCAHALAMQLGGVDQAVAKMNAKAKSLGALDTQVATPSGLDGPGMMTSSFDLAVFYKEAMKHPLFAQAVATKQMDMPGYGGKPGFKVNNDNRLLGTYPGFLGGKTGFTDDARHTYLGGAEQGGHRLLVVLMRGEQHPVLMAEQGGHLFTWAFDLYKTNKADAVGQLTGPQPVGAPPSSGAGSVSAQAGGSPAGTAQGGKAIANNQGALPTIAISVSAVAVLAFAIWRIRRRYARPAIPEPSDAEQTIQLPPIR